MSTMRVTRVLIYLFVSGCCLLGGCERMKRQDLAGVYVITREFGNEVLILTHSGEYVQAVVVHDSVMVHQGVWEYDRESGYVTLVNGLDIHGKFGAVNPHWNEPMKGHLLRAIRRPFPRYRLTLMVDENGGLTRLRD